MPLCVKPSEPVNSQIMATCVIDYLRDSYQHGLKHHNAILSTGCTAGEAAVEFFRKRGKLCPSQNKLTADQVTPFILKAVRKHVTIPFSISTFKQHVHSLHDVIRPHGVSRKFLQELKNFLRAIGVKRKVYCSIVPKIMADVKRLV